MMNQKHIIAAMALLASIPSMYAEDLDTEISIDRQVVPEYRSATKLSLLPELNLPEVTPIKLKATDRASGVNVPGYVMTLDPATYGSKAAAYPWRGYAAIGYFPAFNLGASAGYRLIAKENTSVDAWMQYNGASWHGDVDKTAGTERVSLRRHAVTIGAHATHHVNHHSAFDANFSYGYSTWTAPYAATTVGRRYANRVNIDLGWESRIGHRFEYGAKVGYGLMSYGKGFNENSLNFELEGDYEITTQLYAGVAIEGYSNILDGDGPTKSAIGIRPHIGWKSDKFSASVGVNIDLPMLGNVTLESEEIAGMEATAHVFPDVRAAWTPSGSFCVWGKIEGYTEANTLSSLYDYNYYIADRIYGFSDVTFNGEVGMTLGPWRGASLEFRVGYSDTENWLLPTLSSADSDTWYGEMSTGDLYGIHYGATFKYRYRDLFELKGSIDGAPHSGEKGWYQWRDKARWVAEAGIDVHPIEPLTLSLGNDWRIGRRCGEKSIGNISELNLGGAYRITEALSVFARCENLLNHRYVIMPGVPGQGISGLIGVTYKLK